MLAEVEALNGFSSWFTVVVRHFRLIVFHAMPEVTTFLGKMCHSVCSVSMTPSKARLIGFCYKWKIQSIATERSSRVLLRSTQLFLTVSMRFGYCSSNDGLLDGSTERRLTLAEVEPSNGLNSWLTDVGHHFRLIVFHAMPDVTTFLGNAPSVLLRVCNTKQFRLIGFGNKWRSSVH